MATINSFTPVSVLPRARLAVSVLLTAVVLWVALAGTLPATVGTSRPTIALTVQPFSATALAARAVAGLEKQSAAPSPAALADARRALVLNPTSLPALRVIAVHSMVQGRTGETRRILDYSERLSRRDLFTQLSLIEQSVARNDVAGALVHYDRALRTSRKAAPALMPILIQAVADPVILRALGPMVARRPLWWRELASGLIAPGPHVAAIRPIYHALRLDPKRPEEASLLAQGLGQLVAAHRFGDAAALYREATRQEPGVLRNGGFDAPLSGLAPFDWSLNDDPDLSAAIEARSGAAGDPVLMMTASRKAGSAARLLLLLAPGHHSLSFVTGPTADARPRVAIRCATPPDRVLVAPAAGPKPGRVTAEFVVPNVCPAQWLSFDTSGQSGADENPWIDSIEIVARD